MEGYKLIILVAMVSPVLSVSKPQRISQPFDKKRLNHAGLTIAPEVDMAVYSG